jgi:hypothetical protein
MSQNKKNTFIAIIGVLLSIASAIFMSGSYAERIDNMKQETLPQIIETQKEILREVRTEHDSAQAFRIESRMDRKELHIQLEKHMKGK